MRKRNVYKRVMNTRIIRKRFAGMFALLLAVAAGFCDPAARKQPAVSFAAGREFSGQVDLENSQELPKQFDLRSRREVLAVSDQGDLGTCWAFASLAALSTSMPQEMAVPLSADHMTLKNSFGLGQNDGGDYAMSSSYLLAWQGPVAEEDDPYGDGSSPDGLEPVCHVQTVEILGEKDYGAIKKAVYETGGVQSSLYLPADAGMDGNPYYRRDTHSLCYDGVEEANHDVVIVGWDDGYPRENFSGKPQKDGAFLCMNSWGEDFGDGGFFYVSYEDARIGCHSISYTAVEPVENYDFIHQTDLCGWTGQLGGAGSVAWFANVYETEERETIKAVGFYATKTDTSYRIYFAMIPERGGEADMGEVNIGEAFSERSLMAEGRLKNAGFYTIPWSRGMTVEKNKRFAVLVEIDSPGTEQPVAIEYQAGIRTGNVDISDGEGYISFDGRNWLRTETREKCNVCLKAYGAKAEKK